MATSEMKLCKDCKWCLPDKSWTSRLLGMKFEMARCRRAPKPVETDQVTGRRVGGGMWRCSTERMFSDGCGPEGRRFEPKSLANPSDLVGP